MNRHRPGCKIVGRAGRTNWCVQETRGEIVASEGEGGTGEARAGTRPRACRTLVPERVLVFIPRTLRGPRSSLKEKVIRGNFYLPG